jgi:hypothetical protein
MERSSVAFCCRSAVRVAKRQAHPTRVGSCENRKEITSLVFLAGKRRKLLGPTRITISIYLHIKDTDVGAGAMSIAVQRNRRGRARSANEL